MLLTLDCNIVAKNRPKVSSNFSFSLEEIKLKPLFVFLQSWYIHFGVNSKVLFKEFQMITLDQGCMVTMVVIYWKDIGLFKQERFKKFFIVILVISCVFTTNIVCNLYTNYMN